jgi:hypothetical protein
LAALDPHDSALPEKFGALIQEWDGEFDARFATDLPDAAKNTQAAMLGVTNGVVTMTVPFASLQDAENISPTGLIIRAGVGTFDAGATTAGLSPGFVATPVVSVFDEEAWKVEA